MQTLHVPFCSIDSSHTHIREDGFYTSHSPSRQVLTIASPMPALKEVGAYEVERSLLELQTATYTRLSMPRSYKERMCLNTKKHRQSVVVEYVWDVETRDIKASVGLFRTKLSNIFTFENYTQSTSFERDMAVLSTMLSQFELPPAIQRRVLGFSRTPSDEAYRVVESILYLFNLLCRTYALKNGIPFLGKERDGLKVLFVKHSPNASFNKVFRDPVSLINMSNIVAHLEGKPIIFTHEGLTKILP